jgi:hypothetical protein
VACCFGETGSFQVGIWQKIIIFLQQIAGRAALVNGLMVKYKCLKV